MWSEAWLQSACWKNIGNKSYHLSFFTIFPSFLYFCLSLPFFPSFFFFSFPFTFSFFSSFFPFFFPSFYFSPLRGWVLESQSHLGSIFSQEWDRMVETPFILGHKTLIIVLVHGTIRDGEMYLVSVWYETAYQFSTSMVWYTWYGMELTGTTVQQTLLLGKWIF